MHYRPISPLPVFGKIHEKLIYDAIYIPLCQNNLISSNQSDIRPGDSTINQLLLITNKIYSAFDGTPPKDTRAILLVLSKAFERVSHDGLLYKIKCCGISGNLHALTRSFVSNRRQRVVLNGKRARSGLPCLLEFHKVLYLALYSFWFISMTSLITLIGMSGCLLMIHSFSVQLKMKI